MTTQDNKLFEDQAYMNVYKDILLHPLYDKIFFSNYCEFRVFCDKDLSYKSQLHKLIMTPQIELKKVILDKICEYYTTHNSKTGNINEPITYFKVIYSPLK